jgi:hypothetical protein
LKSRKALFKALKSLKFGKNLFKTLINIRIWENLLQVQGLDNLEKEILFRL